MTALGKLICIFCEKKIEIFNAFVVNKKVNKTYCRNTSNC